MFKIAVFMLALMVGAASAEAQQVRQLLNGLRSEAGLGPLSPSPRLEATAMAHAMDMSENGFFSHDGSDGSTVKGRAQAQGYRPCRIAENISYGSKTPAEVLGRWMKSKPHRRNLLLRDVVDYGLVRAPGNIWVLVLGRDGC
ncbi:MAG: CAP domain-containing protein [Pelagimonas sp.]|jgi:uncharacterized protein YkwD|nr:CAP domain-containing protein [Pelagimonas sp.]